MSHTIPLINRIVLTMLFLLLLLSALTALGQTQQTNELRELPPNQTLEREMTGAETHRYKVDLKANEVFQVRVEQKGVDVALKLTDAQGKTLSTMDSPNSKQGPETLSFVAEKSSSFVLEVSSFNAKAEKGNYSIRREATRTATAKDKRRVEVERLFVAGMTARGVKGQADAAIKQLSEAQAGWQELADGYMAELTARLVKQLKVNKYSALLFGDLIQELNKGQAALAEGQKLMVKSQADSLAARAKLNEALAMFRAINVKLKSEDKALIEKVNQTGELSQQLLDILTLIKFSSKSSEGLSLNGIAQTHDNLGEWQENIAYSKLALAVYQEIIADNSLRQRILPIRRLEAQVFGELGGKLNRIGQTEESLKYMNQAVERFRNLYQETQDPKIKLQEALTLGSIGLVYGRESKGNAKAIEFLTKSLEIYRTFPNERSSVARVLSSIAAQQSGSFDYQAALKNWGEASEIYRELNDKGGESSILQSISLMYWLLNNKSKVNEYVTQHLAILQSTDFAENWKKNLFVNNKGFNVVDEFYTALIEKERLNRIAYAYRLLEDYQKSRGYYEQALAIARSRKEPRDIRSTLSSIAYTFAKSEQWDKAAENYKQALEVSRSQGVREDIADDLKDVGWALLELGKPQEALEYQIEALLSYQSVGVDENSAFSPAYSWLLNELSRTYYALGNRRLAIFYGKRSVNAVQGERQRFQHLDAVSQKGFLEKKEKHYRRLANWLIEEGRLLEAEQVLAMLKEEEILSYLRRDASESDKLQQRADLRPEERDALRRYNGIADNLAALGAEFGKLQELQSKGIKLTEEQEKRYNERSTQIEDASRAFQVFLRQLAEEFAKRAITEKDLQENLALQSDLKSWGEGIVFLYTLVGDDRYRVILVTPDTQVDGKYEIPVAKLNEKIEAFRQAVKNPRLDPRPLGKELYDILIRPIEKQLDGAKAKTLLWSLDGNLRLLPLAALWDGKQYFGQRYQNVTVTLASRTRLGDAVAPNWRALGLGVSEAKKVEVKELSGKTREFPFPALPAVRTELRSIIQSEQSPNGILPGQSLIDAEFNETALETQLVRGYKVIHIASHFSLNPGDATRSFLLLGDGNVLTMDELRNNPRLKFGGVELLTLSACQTAVGEKDSSGKEIEGFGYVAQQKGAKAILATLWSVADESTQLLMSEFYRLRKERPRLTKAAALQLAQQKMIEGKLKPLTPEGKRRGLVIAGENFAYDPKKPYAHPYYWSPFILIGNWR
jgi:CHAT domain-containing protein/tetratricopeptide (TPR) repeat protein